MATKSIGFVADLNGAAEIRGVDGVVRVLSIGDPVYDGDVLSTAPGTEILLEFFNGSRLALGEISGLLLDETVIPDLQEYFDAQVNQILELKPPVGHWLSMRAT